LGDLFVSRFEGVEGRATISRNGVYFEEFGFIRMKLYLKTIDVLLNLTYSQFDDLSYENAKLIKIVKKEKVLLFH